MADALQGYWRDLTTEALSGVDGERTILVLPVAAIEQHGPHLPVGVDADINEGLIAAALKALPAALSVLVLPQQSVGWSDEHGAYPGTLSIGPETLAQAWRDIAEGAIDAGFRKLVLFNSHGGQAEIIRIVARKLRLAHNVLAVPVSWFSLVDQSDLFDEDELAHGIHAGAVETSIMLHLRPDAVHMDRAARFDSSGVEMSKTFRRLKPTGAAPFGWATQDLHVSGAVGDPTAASAEKGRVIVERAVQGMIDLFADIDAFDLARLKPAL